MTGRKNKIQKSLSDALNKHEKQKEDKETVSLFYGMAQKKYSSSLSRQSKEIK